MARSSNVSIKKTAVIHISIFIALFLALSLIVVGAAQTNGVNAFTHNTLNSAGNHTPIGTSTVQLKNISAEKLYDYFKNVYNSNYSNFIDNQKNKYQNRSDAFGLLRKNYLENPGFYNISVVAKNESAFNYSIAIPIFASNLSNTTIYNQLNLAGIFNESLNLSINSSNSGYELVGRTSKLLKQIKTPIIYSNTTLKEITVYLKNSYSDSNTSVYVGQNPKTGITPLTKTQAYAYISVNSTINDAYVQYANYTFSVNKSWINSEGISPGQIALYKYIGNAWKEMPTLMTGNNSTAYFYDGESDSLSNYAISYSTGGASGSANPLSVILPTGYSLYLCDGGANYTFATGKAGRSWTLLQKATSPASPPPAASVGYQTSNICTASVPTTPSYYVGLAIAGIGLNITHYNFYGASANSSATASLTYPVAINGSFVAILVASGYYGLNGTPSIPSGCIVQQETTNSTGYESAYVATCNNVSEGNYSVSASNGNDGATVIGAFVFPPANVVFDDSPSAGSITTNGKTFQNGESANILGKGSITANPPNSNFVFTNWSFSNGNRFGNTFKQYSRA